VWHFYALGGGMGHFARTFSLARKAAKMGIQSRILSNSASVSSLSGSHVHRLLPDDPAIYIDLIPPQFDKNAIQAATTAWMAAIGADDVFLVDTFPRGLAGELPKLLTTISGLKVFIHRNICQKYVQCYHLEKMLPAFDLVILPGEKAPLSHMAHALTAPWMICDQEELLSRQESRHSLSVPNGNNLPLVVVTGCGNRHEAILAAKFASRMHQKLAAMAVIRFASLDIRAIRFAPGISCSPWPLLSVMPGIDLLVSSGGYNSVHESRYSGTPLLAIPQKRVYDRQADRLLASEAVSNLDTALDLAKKIIATPAASQQNPDSVRKKNGTHEAFNLIMETLKKT
jgi:hypothetical protein